MDVQARALAGVVVDGEEGDVGSIGSPFELDGAAGALEPVRVAQDMKHRFSFLVRNFIFPQR